MKTLWNRLLCLFGRHSYYKIKELSDYSVKVGCLCCLKQWGMHHPTKSFIEWDKDLADIYHTKVTWGEITMTDSQKDITLKAIEERIDNGTETDKDIEKMTDYFYNYMKKIKAKVPVGKES